jgi:hypothetical protein
MMRMARRPDGVRRTGAPPVRGRSLVAAGAGLGPLARNAGGLAKRFKS